MVLANKQGSTDLNKIARFVSRLFIIETGESRTSALQFVKKVGHNLAQWDYASQDDTRGFSGGVKVTVI